LLKYNKETSRNECGAGVAARMQVSLASKTVMTVGMLSSKGWGKDSGLQLTW